MARTGNLTLMNKNVPTEKGKATKAVPGRHLLSQLDIVRRERDQLAEDMKLLRIENELLKKSSALYSDIKIIGVLINDFTSYRPSVPNWKEQLQLLIDTYKLDEIMPKFFVKLKVAIMRFLHSNGENICINTDELLQRMDVKCDSFGNWIRLNNGYAYENWNWSYRNNPKFTSF